MMVKMMMIIILRKHVSIEAQKFRENIQGLDGNTIIPYYIYDHDDLAMIGDR